LSQNSINFNSFFVITISCALLRREIEFPQIVNADFSVDFLNRSCQSVNRVFFKLFHFDNFVFKPEFYFSFKFIPLGLFKNSISTRVNFQRFISTFFTRSAAFLKFLRLFSGMLFKTSETSTSTEKAPTFFNFGKEVNFSKS